MNVPACFPLSLALLWSVFPHAAAEAQVRLAAAGKATAVIVADDWEPTPHGKALGEALAQRNFVKGKCVLELGGASSSIVGAAPSSSSASVPGAGASSSS